MNVFNWYKIIDVYGKLFYNELVKKKEMEKVLIRNVCVLFGYF